MHLVPVLPPLSGETVVSWCGRIARYHAEMTSHDFLQTIQLSRQDVVDATDYGIARLSTLTGIDPARIAEGAIRRDGDRIFHHRGERFGTHFGCRTNVSYCPLCLIEDGTPNSPSLGMRVGQMGWLFKPVRSCARHGIGLVRRPRTHFSQQFQDMAIVAPSDEILEQEATAAPTLPGSPLQIYVARRFAGEVGPCWLDGQMIDQASKASEMIGACLEYGVDCNLEALTIGEWHHAGAAGYEATAAGPDGIREALDRIRHRSEIRCASGGPQALFGRLYQWLQFNKGSRDPGPIRELLRGYILETMAIAPGTRLFGETVKERRRHTVASLARESKVHLRTLQRALVRSGLLADGDTERIDPWANVAADAGEALVRRINGSIPIKQIPVYLNCNRRQAELLVREGILSQIVPSAGERGGVLSNVTVEDIDAFVDQLRATGRNVEDRGNGMMDVISASEVARHPVIDIVRLILDRTLTNIELLPRSLGFRSVLVDPNEVSRAMDARESRLGLSRHEVAVRLNIYPSGVTHLRDSIDRNGHPFLHAKILRNARGTTRHRFAPAEVDRFASAHVPLSDLAAERRTSSRSTSELLNDQGILPIVPRRLLGNAYYRRVDVS